jgi:hypothetical protein
MKHRKSLLLLAAVAAICHLPAAHAGWVTVSDSGTLVLTTCNPKPFPMMPPGTCLITGQTLLAALGTGYTLKSSASGTITANGHNVGTHYDRVYCIGADGVCATSGEDADTYVLASRVHLLSGAWNGHSSESFEVNDTIRLIKSGVSADIAYWMGPDTGGSTSSSDPDLALANMKWLEYSGKTQYGLHDVSEAVRDNNYIDFRQDANASDPDGVSSEWSAWLVVRQVCNSGIAASRGLFNVKLWEGGEELQDHYTQWMPGYKCN